MDNCRKIARQLQTKYMERYINNIYNLDGVGYPEVNPEMTQMDKLMENILTIQDNLEQMVDKEQFYVKNLRHTSIYIQIIYYMP
jgi:hypothetical protein